MLDLCSIHIITRRELGDRLQEWMQRKVNLPLSRILCSGTATRKLLDLAGLEDSEKIMVSAVCSRPDAARIMHGLVNEVGLSLPGCGVAFTMPISGIGGNGSLNALMGDTKAEEGTNMTSEFKYELLVCIINRGYSEDVMNAARDAGAMGGTIVGAKGTLPKESERFFGMSIASEKEIILILAAACQKKPIMQSIMTKAGIQSPAHTVLFSMPVESVAGLKSIMEAAGEAE